MRQSLKPTQAWPSWSSLPKNVALFSPIPEAKRIVKDFEPKTVRDAFWRALLCRRKRIVMGDTEVSISRAPEPDDIYWENLSVGFSERLARNLLTYFACMLLITLSAFGLYELTHVKQRWEEELASGDEAFSSNSLKIRSLSWLVSLAIAFINNFLKKLIQYFSKYEKKETYTRYHLSVALKMLIVKYFILLNRPLL